MRDKRAVVLLRNLVLGVLLVAQGAWAWGFDGHRRLASVMQDAMPAGHCLRTWFASRQTYTLQNHACDPDRWRGSDPDEAPRHFLEIDWVTPISRYPRDYAAVVQLLGERNARQNGIVPWRIEERYGTLIDAFRSSNADAILDQAFVLSHYVFDSFSVLHDTKNYDPNGLHARWESDMLNVSANIDGITAAAEAYYGVAGRAHPRDQAFDIIVVGNGLVGPLIDADVAAQGDLAALYLATKELTARRWGDGITMMSSLLWSAWDEAGRPELAGFSGGCSRAAPPPQLELHGYPLDGGSKPDGGATADAGPGDGGIDASVDAGQLGLDAGVDGGTSGTPPGPIGFLPLGGGGGSSNEPAGCGCTTLGGWVSLAGCASLFGRWRRRRS